MKQNDHYFELINKHLTEKGIEDPDIRMELSDHFCELLDQDQLENEIIPADILSRVDNHFEAAQFNLVYKKLISLKMKSDGSFIKKILSNFSIGQAFLLLILHRVVFFTLLPLIPINIYNPFEPMAMAITAIFYFGMGSFFVMKAIKLAKS